MTKLKSVSKRTISVLLCMVMLLTVFMSVPFTASAADKYTYEENGIQYVEDENGEMGIIGFNPAILPEHVVIPTTVQGKPVTSIEESSAFYESTMKSIVLPDSVTDIAPYAFSQCYELESIIIEGQIKEIKRYTFWDCESLTEIDLPDSIEYIDMYAFDSCISLKSIELPKKLKSLGNEAFIRCASLEKVIINPELETIGIMAFAELESLTDVIFEDKNTEITVENYAFSDCKNLTNIDFSCIKDIKMFAFSNCSNLKTVTFGEVENLTLGQWAFSNCTSLESVTLTDEFTTIPPECFSGCTSLKNVYAPNVTKIEYNAFKNCTGMESFDFTNVEKIGDDAFKNCTSLKAVKLSDKITYISCFSGCTSLESIQANSITSIGNNAFSGCTNLTDISFAKNNDITYIGAGAFKNCSKLTEISLLYAEYIYSGAFGNCTSLIKVDLQGNKKLESIGVRAFYNCTSLESIDIPATCEEISDEAFMNCESLYYVDIKSGLKKIGEKAFFNCYSLYNIIIPKSVETIGGMALGCYEKDGNYYSFSDFVVVGVKSSLADEYADVYNVYWALNAPKLSKVENTSSGVKITFAKASGASSGKYEVYRCTDSSEWKMLGTTTSLSYTDKTAKSGTKYYYTVQFVGKPTNSLNDYPLEIVRLSIPKVSKITNTNSGAQLTWSKITGAAKYNVYVKSGSKWKKLGDTTSTSFTHTTAKSGTTYKYTVKAYDSSGEYASAYDSSGFSNKFVASPKISKTSNTTTGVKITWGKVAGAEKYRVFVKSGSKWKKLKDTTSTSYTHTGRESGKTYTYTVRCISSTGKSYKSGYDKEGTKHLYLATPKVKKISNTIDGAKITWGKIEGAAKYNVYVKSNSKWKKIGDSTTTSFTHTAAKSGTTYTYTVKAYDETGGFASAYKSAGDKNKFIAAPVISELTSTSKGVKIKWGEVKGAVNYRVFVKTDASADWTKLTDTTDTSFTHKKAKSGKTYYYTVRCISSTGKSYVSGYDKAGQSILFEN